MTRDDIISMVEEASGGRQPDGWGVMLDHEQLERFAALVAEAERERCPKCSYQAPRFRDEWVGLTDEEIDAAVKSCNTVDTYKYFRAIEAKLKEKNNG